MRYEIIISGFGGQGALFAGQLLAYAAMENGMFVTWLPSYGPEMRGGTAHCTTIIADEVIGSPVVRNPGIVLALNQPSIEKYEPLLALQGLLIYNALLAVGVPTRSDITILAVPASAIAEELGNERLLNVVMIGVLLRATQVFSLEAMEWTLSNHLPERHRDLLEQNIAALRRGAAWVCQNR